MTGQTEAGTPETADRRKKRITEKKNRTDDRKEPKKKRRRQAEAGGTSTGRKTGEIPPERWRSE